MRINRRLFEFFQTKVLTVIIGIIAWGILSAPLSLLDSVFTWFQLFAFGIFLVSVLGAAATAVVFIVWVAACMANVWHGREEPWRVYK